MIDSDVIVSNMAYNYQQPYGPPQPYRYGAPNQYHLPPAQQQRPPPVKPAPYHQRQQYPPAQSQPAPGYPPQNTMSQPAPGYPPQNRMSQPNASLPVTQPSPMPSQPQPSQSLSPSDSRGRKASNASSSALGGRKASLSDVRVPHDKIRELSKEKLEKIQSDEGEYLEFFTSIKPDLADLKRVEDERMKLQQENRDAAEKTLEKEPALRSAVNQMVLLTTEARELKEQYDEKTQKLIGMVSRFETPELKRDLEKAAKTAEEESESLMEDFVAGKATFDEFKEKFLELRTTYWLRKVKTDKLTELNKRRPSATRSGSGPQGPAPYPLAPRMPVPGSYR